MKSGDSVTSCDMCESELSKYILTIIVPAPLLSQQSSPSHQLITTSHGSFTLQGYYDTFPLLQLAQLLFMTHLWPTDAFHATYSLLQLFIFYDVVQRIANAMLAC